MKINMHAGSYLNVFIFLLKIILRERKRKKEKLRLVHTMHRVHFPGKCRIQSITIGQSEFLPSNYFFFTCSQFLYVFNHLSELKAVNGFTECCTLLNVLLIVSFFLHQDYYLKMCKLNYLL